MVDTFEKKSREATGAIARVEDMVASLIDSDIIEPLLDDALFQLHQAKMGILEVDKRRKMVA